MESFTSGWLRLGLELDIMHGEDSLTDSQRLTVSALATSRAATIFPKLENHNRAGHNKEHDSPEQVS